MSWDEAYSKGEGMRWCPEGAFVAFVGATYKKLIHGHNGCALELGCGTGRNLWWLYEYGFDIFGLDSSPAAIATANDYLELRTGVRPSGLMVATLPTIPALDNTYDLVVDCQTLQHLDPMKSERWTALDEILRVLKPGGLFWSMMFTGTAEDAKKIYEGKYPELGYITERQWLNTLKRSGFHVDPNDANIWSRSYMQHEAAAHWLVVVGRKL